MQAKPQTLKEIIMEHNKFDTIQNSQENIKKIYTKIKETWRDLSNSDVKLYDECRTEFFAKVQEKQKVSRVEAQKKLQRIEKDCGCTDVIKAA